jgi:hypothetical protein
MVSLGGILIERYRNIDGRTRVLEGSSKWDAPHKTQSAYNIYIYIIYLCNAKVLGFPPLHMIIYHCNHKILYTDGAAVIKPRFLPRFKGQCSRQ